VLTASRESTLKVERRVSKMATQDKNNKRRRPATTPEGREHQLINLAVDLAEQQLADGTASSQVITHYLKLGSTKDILERNILARQGELLEAKTDALKSAKRVEELYEDALKAMKNYKGDD
jgi:hypothetical protein